MLINNPDRILTYSGIWIDPYAISPEEVALCDIAHALSLMTRANGHFRTFYSVAQHCINASKEALARGHEARIARACLLHDATEVYISDVTRPVKRGLKGYAELESRISDAVFERFKVGKLTEPEAALVGAIDDALLIQEFQSLLGAQLSDTPPELIARPDFDVRDMREVEAEYLNVAESLGIA